MRSRRGFLWAGLVAFGVALAAPAAISAAQPSAADWPSFTGDLTGRRYSPLQQVNRQTVARLKTVCEADMGILGTFHTGPVLIGDSLYLTTGFATVALDPTNCQVRWKHLYKAEAQGIGTVNRGVAYLDGRLFRGTPDGRVLAIDAATGKELWRVAAADPKLGEYFTSAALAWDGLVFIGTTGSDFGIKGRILAFDAVSGREVWRFNTIPAEGEYGFDTWKLPRLEHYGGAGTWSAFTLDPATGELFVPLGNPAPMYSPLARPGDNLFTNSIVALDAKTGQRHWHYQFTPNDSHDYDVSAPPMLYRDAHGRDMVAVGSKDGFVYGIDRRTHKLVFKTAVTTIFNQDKIPTPEGIRACPGNVGGVQWNGPAYDPLQAAIYVGAVDWCGIFNRSAPSYVAGQVYFGGGYKPAEPSEKARGWISALDGASGKLKWKRKTQAPVLAGVTPTAGGLIFTGDMKGRFYALDARNGKILFSQDTGGSMTGGMLTYERGARQYVTFTSGSMTPRGFSFDTEGRPKLVIMALDGAAEGPRLVHVDAEPSVIASTMTAHGDSDPVARGRQLFGQVCSACHGGDGGGVSGPSLKSIFQRKSADAVVATIKSPKDPMPRLYPGALNDEDLAQLMEFLKTLQ